VQDSEPAGNDPLPDILPLPVEERAATTAVPPSPDPLSLVKLDSDPMPDMEELPPPVLVEERPFAGPVPTDGPARPATLAFKRRDSASEVELRRQLTLTPEVGIGQSGPRLVQAYASKARANMAFSGDAGSVEGSTLVEVVPSAGMLPMHFGSDVQTSPRAAATLASLAFKLRAYLNAAAPPGLDGRRASSALLSEALRREKRGKRPEWLRAEAIPTMLQLLVHEDTPVRHMLVELLSDIPGPASTAGLARRAVFDLDAGLRAKAATALKERPAAEYRPILLAALRYPWSPPADHAAETLAALGDKGAVPELVTLLKEPDPAAPRKLSKSVYVVKELVRAGHQTNCLLCHPPATTGSEPVLALDPWQTVQQPSATMSASIQRLQTNPGSPSYGGGCRSGGMRGGSSSMTPVPLVIRGDIVFLRQDFSVQLPILNRPVVLGQAPSFRWDCMVRTRRLSPSEVKGLKDRPEAASYAQREAVLFALRELTGKDAGDATEAWVRLFPQAQTEVDAARLAEKLVKAGPVRLAQLLGQTQEMTDEACIEGLARALPRLRGEVIDRVQEALAKRLARLDADALRRRLQGSDPVIRQAAIAACAHRGDRALVPDLIALLEAQDSSVAKKALAELERMTGMHFTNSAGWRDWWQAQEGS
jgi:HEAT repeat protein